MSTSIECINNISSPLQPPDESFEVFTTLRYDGTLPGDHISAQIPLFTRHVQRLATSWSHFSKDTKLGQFNWNDSLCAALEASIPPTDRQRNLRLKASVQIDQDLPIIDIQVFAFDSAPLFNGSLSRLDSTPSGTCALSQVLISPQPVCAQSSDRDFLLHKTSQRGIYDTHTSIAHQLLPTTMTVLLYSPVSSSTSHKVTETAISNILFLPPLAEKWITPSIESSTPFLPGLMRQELLDKGEIAEQTITLDDVRLWLNSGGRVACCNALRGIWEVNLVWSDK
ncbi:para-aminobenzoate synthase [Phaffia rhodozyma]|uniref:Para-aminobenzoate synthase n=1 Tax=Phaffia rhodozyma TaxID=264483 RepID=A0A0F7SIB4_PHARH|nr:para-aminobenzoate synthase [Phaffia rhodozyma]